MGYIGLPTALMLASHGIEVVGTDYNKKLINTLNSGQTTFKESGLDQLFREAVEAGIKFSTNYQITDTYIISVPTPYDKFSKKVDASYVVAAIKSVLDVANQGAAIVIESTVSPGTIDKYIRPIINEIGKAPLIALTATATPKVQHDIQKNLGMVDAQVFKSSFNRPNLYYEVRAKTANIDRDIIKFIKNNPEKSGIVYCLSRKRVENLLKFFRQTVSTRVLTMRVWTH